MEDPSNFSEKGSSSLLSNFGNSAVINRWCRYIARLGLSFGLPRICRLARVG